MNVLVVGATGGTGRCLVDQCLQAGHTVTALARDPAKVTTTHAKLKVLKGDVLDAGSLDVALQGQDAVLCALGTRDRSPTNTVVSQGTRNLVTAMQRAGVKRILVVSSMGVGESKAHAGFFVNRILVPLLLKDAFREKELQEATIKESGLEWTIVRPGGLQDKPATGKVRALVGGNVSATVGRADVAAFMVRELESREFVRQAPAVGV